MAKITKRENNIDQCFVKIKEAAEQYLYSGDSSKAEEYALTVRAYGSMISDIIKAKGKNR